MDQDLMDTITRSLKTASAGDEEGALDIFDRKLASPGIDILTSEYLQLLDMKFMIHMKVADKRTRREYHLKKARETRVLFLATPFSYADPHGRIDAEIDIAHIDEWLKEPFEPGEVIDQ